MQIAVVARHAAFITLGLYDGRAMEIPHRFNSSLSVIPPGYTRYHPDAAQHRAQMSKRCAIDALRSDTSRLLAIP